MSSQRYVPSPHLGVSCGLPRPMGLLAKFSIPSRLLGQDNPEPRGLGPIFCCPVSQTPPADTEHPIRRLRPRFPQLGPRWGPGNICRTRVCLLAGASGQPEPPPHLQGFPASRWGPSCPPSSEQVSGNYSPTGGLPSLLMVASSLCSSSPLVSLQQLRFLQGQLHKP